VGLAGLTGLRGLGGIVPGVIGAPPDPVPISAWGFNNNGLDSFGLNNFSADGTIQYSTTRREGSHSYDSTESGNLRANDSASLDITGGLTIDFFMRPTLQPASINRGLVSKWIGATAQRSYVVAFLPDRRISFGVSATGAAVTAINSASSIPLNAWIRITCVYSPSNYIRIYLNGLLSIELATGIPASLFNGSAPLWVGCQFELSPSYRFTGQIDDLKIYNQVVLP
jgi:hypothetical protein